MTSWYIVFSLIFNTSSFNGYYFQYWRNIKILIDDIIFISFLSANSGNTISFNGYFFQSCRNIKILIDDFIFI